MFENENELRKTIKQDYEQTGPEGKRSFRKAVEKEYYYSEALGERLPPGTAATIYNKGACNGPIPIKWQKAFGIYHYDLAPVCPHCLEVHTRKTCPHKTTNQPRKRTNVNLTNATSAKDTIINSPHTTLAYIKALADELTNHLVMQEMKGS